MKNSRLLYLAERLRALSNGKLQPTFANFTTDTQVFVEWDGPRVTVLFPGSASVRDWRTNSKVVKTAWQPGGQAHRGFVAAYLSIARDLNAHLHNALSITFAGHSLGGAIATLAASVADASGRPVDHVVTFGSPRVGNREFAAEYNEALYYQTCRVVNSGDPVPHIPWLLSTYKHVGQLCYLHRDGTMRVEQPVRTVAAEAAEKLRAVRGDLAADFIGADQHSLAAYCLKLRSLQN